jgi:hypothetical protein
MMHEAMRQEELDRIDTLTITQIVAYVNWLNIRLRSKGCTDEERKNGLELLERLTERVRFLETTLSPVFP